MKKLLENLRKTDKIIEELKKSLEEEVLWRIIRSHNRCKTEEYLRLIETQKNNQPIDKESFNRFDLYRWKRGTYPDGLITKEDWASDEPMFCGSCTEVLKNENKNIKST